ncbi:carbohydrate esterase family 1 protein [Hymenopellis radicata]|nr:carbohydrate esterase family 1 protein [Hymenopellis radicata]
MLQTLLLSLSLISLTQIPFVRSLEQYAGGDTSGCGKTHWFNGITHYALLTSSGITRSYSIHAPANYSSTTPYPLVLGFHGSSSIGLFLEADSGLSSSKYSANKIMVYPNGIGGAWAGPSYATTTVEQDLQFVWDVLAAVRASYCVDSARIYATGMSNGGGFVDSLACNATVGGEFAAFAPVAGSFYTDTKPDGGGCTPARGLTPIIEFHGGNDQTVHYEGGQGEGGIEPPISDWLNWWGERSGCDMTPTQEDSFDGDVHHLRYDCPGEQGAGAMQHWKVDDMGHVWPSTEPNFSQIAAGEGPTHIEASSLLMTFFDQFVRPA